MLLATWGGLSSFVSRLHAVTRWSWFHTLSWTVWNEQFLITDVFISNRKWMIFYLYRFFYSNIFEKKRKILNEPGPVNGNWNVSFSFYPIELFLLVGKSSMFMHQRHTASNIDHHLFSDVSLDRTSFLNQLWCNHRNHQTLRLAASKWTCSFSQYKCLL